MIKKKEGNRENPDGLCITKKETAGGECEKGKRD